MNQQALIRSAQLSNHGETPELGAIYRCAEGVIFLATPHRGSGKVEFADILVLAAKVTWRNPNKELLDLLRENSAILNQQRKAFTTIMQKMSIVCLYEENESKIGMVSS